MKYVCPKCRAVGSPIDCADLVKHGAEGMTPDDDGTYELEVTMTFTTPVTSTLPLDPVQMATHLREQWMNDDTQLRSVVSEAVEGEYDLHVAPVYFS